MSTWLLAIHVFGVLVWFAGTMTSLHLLVAHAQAPEDKRGDFGLLAGKVGVVMDIGFTVALITGVSMLLGSSRPLLSQGFMHVKLTLVVVLLALHGMTRARLGKFKRGEVAPMPGWLAPVVVAVYFAIAVAIEVRPF